MQVGCGSEESQGSRVQAECTTLPGSDIFWNGSTSLLTKWREGLWLPTKPWDLSAHLMLYNRGQMLPSKHKGFGFSWGIPRPWICNHCGAAWILLLELLLLSSCRAQGQVDTWRGTLTRHRDDLGFVVRVSIRDGLGQVVNCYLILLTRIYHKVAEGKPPLKTQGDGMGHITPSLTYIQGPNLTPPHNQLKTNKRRITESKIRCMISLSFYMFKKKIHQ